VTNDVVQPQDWDNRGKGVNTDRIDALALCQRFDRCTRGNLKAQDGGGALFCLRNIVRCRPRTRSGNGLSIVALDQEASFLRTLAQRADGN
jgi:hypothetical protein